MMLTLYVTLRLMMMALVAFAYVAGAVLYLSVYILIIGYGALAALAALAVAGVRRLIR